MPWGWVSLGYDERYYLSFDSKILFINSIPVCYSAHISADRIDEQAKEVGKKLLFDQHHFSWNTLGDYIEASGLKKDNITLKFFDDRFVRYEVKTRNTKYSDKNIRYIDWTD